MVCMMARAVAARRGTSSGAAALVALVACSSPSHPTPLGDCVPGPDASCGVVSTGGGGSSGGISAPPDDSGACVVDDTVVISTSTPCRSCIVDSCCAAVTSCKNDGSCLLVLSCAKGCAGGATFCVAGCESPYPAASQQLYESMAKCLETSCSTKCPTLTLGTNPE